MPTLSSLLVQRGIASIRGVEDAIARQVFHGGDLATNLLELGAIREDALLEALAESHGLEAAPAGHLPAPPPEVLRVVPADLAVRHGMFPLAERDRTLVVAVSEPLPPTVEDDLGFALDLALRQVISTQLRIRQAIAGCYGVPLDRRFLRLQAKLEGRADPSPSAMPPPHRDLLPGRLPQPVSIPVPTFSSGVPGSERAPARLQAVPAPKTPYVDAPQDLVNPAIPKSPALPHAHAPHEDTPPAGGVVLTPPSDRVELSVISEPGPESPIHTKPYAPSPSGGDGPAPMPAPPQNPALVQVADTLPGPPIAERPEVSTVRSSAATKALAGMLRDAIREERAVDKHKTPTWRAAERRRKGPFTAARAEEELEHATSTDEVLEILFAFSVQFFEYAALFVVHGDLAEGRDAAGPGADRAAVAGIGVPLDLPSHLSTARSTRAPVVARPATSGLDADLARDLGRAKEEPRAVAYLPVAVRTRTVAILIGDDGDAAVDLGAIGDVISFIGLAGSALERIALRKKLGAAAPEMSLKVRIQEGAAALARTIAETAAIATRVGASRVARPTRPSAAADAEPRHTPPPQASHRPTLPTPSPELTTRAEPEPEPEPEALAVAEPESSEEGASSSSYERVGAANTRRGLAPLYEGRSAAVTDGAQMEWRRPMEAALEETTVAEPVEDPSLRRERRDSTVMGLGPLPATPPSNATSWSSSSFAGDANRRPLPREETRASSVPPLAGTPRDLLAQSPLRDLIQRVIEGGHRGREAFDELSRMGEQSVQAVMARFPGPLRVDRHRARGELPPASQCGPILELVVAIRRPALPFVSVRSSAPEAEMRFWAAHTLGELRYPEAATVLVPRLFDDDAQVRRIARRSAAALVGAGAVGAPILKGLEDITRNPDEPKVHRLVAIETMGEIRSGSLVPPLLEALEDHSEEVADAARRALLLVTRQDFGKDLEQWHHWWTENANRHRIEWLIDALMHEQPGVRRAAGDELKLATKEYFGYYDDLPKRDRERAQGLYRAWWQREGRRRFE